MAHLFILAAQSAAGFFLAVKFPNLPSIHSDAISAWSLKLAHRGQKAAERLRSNWPSVVLVHTPIHASWLNQIEIYFSVVQRKVLSPNDFSSLAELQERLLAFPKSAISKSLGHSSGPLRAEIWLTLWANLTKRHSLMLPELNPRNTSP